MPKLLCIMALCAACAAAQTTVEGTVVNSVTRKGIEGIAVELIWSGESAYSATTDAQGNFRIENVLSGVYNARYSSSDYLRDRDSPATRFQVFAGTPVKLEARMIPFGRVSGRVVDGRSEPVAGAAVIIASANATTSLKTNAKGEFDLHDFLLPGNYTCRWFRRRTSSRPIRNRMMGA